MPLISVVVPVYNKEPHITRTLKSILRQTFQEFEIIIVDDGSTDKSAEVVRSFTDSRIRLIQQENMGVSAARNKGIVEAKTDLVAFLDADDEWAPNFLETILRLRKIYPEAGVYTTAYAICQPYSHKVRIANYKAIPSAPWEGLIPSYFLTAALGEPPVCSSTTIVPKKVFTEIGMFQKGVWWGEDTDMWGRIALKYPVAFSWEIGSIYHKEAVNRACNKNVPVIEHPFITTARKAINDKNLPRNILKDLEEYTALLTIYAATQNVFVGNNKNALVNLINCKTRVHLKRKLFWIFLALIPHDMFKFAQRIKRRLFL